MSIRIRRASAVVAGITLIGLVACETSEMMETSPGALPKRLGVTPRLNASTFVAHGELLERRGDLERAAAQYRRALELTPDLVAARNRLGVTLNKLGRHADASAQFRQALARQPRMAYLHNNLGFSLYLEKDYAEAEQVLARAVELQPSFRRARMNHGLVLARVGRYEAALEEFAAAGTKADAHYNVAVIQAEEGQYAKAAQSLERAIECDPKLTAARDYLRQISHLAAAQEAAEAEARRIAAEAAEAERLAAIEADARRLAAAEAERERRAEAEAEARRSAAIEAAIRAQAEVAVTDAEWANGDIVEPETMVADAVGPDRGPGDIVTAVDIESVRLMSLPPMIVPASLDVSRVTRIFAQLEASMAVTEVTSHFPVVAPIFQTVDRRLQEVYDELLYAVTVEGALSESCLYELEEMLGLTHEPY